MFPVENSEVPVPTFSACPDVRPLPVLIAEAVPVVVALFTATVPVLVVLPVKVLLPATVSLPVV